MDVGQIHILVVDDSADEADSTVELLTIWGYDACACYTGASALKAALAHQPDAVLLDLAMPRMDGFQFAELFRELPDLSSIPIIAVTGYAGATYYARAKEAGITHYLLKPAKPVRLKELLMWEIEPLAIHAPLFDEADTPIGARLKGRQLALA